MTEPSRRERYLRALEIAERHGNKFMAQNIRAELRKLDAEPLSQPEPKVPTVMEIIELADEIEAEGLGQVDLVRHALARWCRPKPTSLKEQALELAKPAGTEGAYVTFGPEELALIRRALEALPND